MLVFAMRFDRLIDGRATYATAAVPTPVPTPTPQPANTRNITGVITHINTQSVPHTITLLNIANNNSRDFTFVEDLTRLTNRHGNEIYFEHLSVGNVMEAAYDPDTRELLSLGQSITRDFHSRLGLRFDMETSSVTIGNDELYFTEHTLVLYRGNPHNIADITSDDIVTIIAMRDTIWLVEVESGHGFLQVANADSIMQGMITLTPIGGTGGSPRIISIDTMDGPQALPEGRFSVSVSGRNIEIYTTEIEIVLGETASLDLSNVVLSAAVLELTVSPAGSQVFINDVLLTPQTEMEFEFGTTLVIRAEHDGYYSQQRTVEMVNAVNTVTITLEEETPVTRLTVTTIPPGALVWINNQQIGTSPISMELPPGRHNVTAYAPGFESYTTDVELIAGENNQLLILTAIEAAPTPLPPIDDPFPTVPPDYFGDPPVEEPPPDYPGTDEDID